MWEWVNIIVYFTSTEKKVLTTHANLSQLCLLGTTELLRMNVPANEQSASGNQTQDLMIVWPTLYFEASYSRMLCVEIVQ